ncbi:uncharacterized protein LOC127796594 [Diospyros lotus]|uniref:uncharacterized protein LOC127796594 n=1 Tax=Diospyros lotus TaxID=55363 RepID=UPI00224E7AC8|nr:uncharacterized protein LOC127796594 [Diospyros lotus]XP_052184756.1 uncharacterized protein LOC127796594 [Diospyros lotus]
MRSLSTVGVGLSVIFGCLALALVAEIYYLLWWKKRRITNQSRRESFCTFFWKRKRAPPSTAAIAAAQELCSSVAIAVEEPQPLLYAPHPNWPKTLQENDADSQLPRLQPRFLFTIKEESEEDLESDENGEEGSRSRSLNELLLLTVETPFVTPLASPSYFTPPLTPSSRHHHHYQHGFSPLSRSLTDAEFNRMRSSPPPKFKFLKDAEDKLYRRMLMEEAEKEQLHMIDGSGQGAKADEFITLIVAKNKDSSSSQVLPLPSSPPTFRPPIINKKPVSHHQISSIK